MPPLNNKTIAFFFAKVIAIYAVLMVPWPGLEAVYGKTFCAAGNLAFRFFGKDGRTRFRLREPAPTGADAVDYEIRLENVRTRAGGTFDPDRRTRKMGYLPTAFAASLVLATPIGWRRRGWAFLWAVVLVSAFVGLQVAIHLTNAFSDANALNQFGLGPTMKSLLDILLKVVVTSPVTAYIAPIFVWIAVTFRREDWKSLMASREPGLKAGALGVGG